MTTLHDATTPHSAAPPPAPEEHGFGHGDVSEQHAVSETVLPATAPPPLRRPAQVLLSGVSRGLAAHLGCPVAVVRAVFVATALLGGGGILLYAWLWALVPRDDGGDAGAGANGAEAGVRRRRGDGRAVRQPSSSASEQSASLVAPRRAVPVAGILVVLSALFAIVGVPLSARTEWPILGPGLIESAVLGVLAVVWSLGPDRRDTARSARSGRLVRVAAAVVLLATGALLLISQPRADLAVYAVVVLICGAIILVIPRVVRLWTDLIAERSARVREEHRAEVAAHLHDSVLQTLALIQNRAGAHSEAGRIARAQERELRDWLFAGSDPFAGDLATELRRIATELELEHEVRIEVVTVGETDAPASAAVVGAAREAMLNAARHAGGEVSVYVEMSATAVDVFVRDRGSGFDQGDVPDSRLGIRESILGRMDRAGGSASVRSEDDGTEVHIHLAEQPARAQARS